MFRIFPIRQHVTIICTMYQASKCLFIHFRISIKALSKFILTLTILLSFYRAVIGLREDSLKNYFESKTKFNTSNPLAESKQLLNSINLQFADWGRSSTNLLLVINNDLYFIDQYNTGHIDNIQRLTFDGIPSSIYNGIMDYTYSSKSLF